MTDQVLEFRWVVPESERLVALGMLESGGGIVQSSGEHFRPAGDVFGDGSASSFEPLIVIVCLVGAVRLLRQLEELWRDSRSEGGWVVDLREGKVELRSIPGTPRGELVIVTDRGATAHRCDSGRSAREKVEEALSETTRR